MTSALIDNHHELNRTVRAYDKKSKGFLAFDFTCRHYMHMSGEEFLRRFDAGEYQGSDEPRVLRASAMIDFVR